MRPRFPLACPTAAVAILALWAAAPARGANEPATIENVRPGFQGRYKIGAWTPIVVDLKGGPARFQGILEVEVADDDGTPTIFRREVDLSRPDIETIALYTRAGSQHAELNVSLWDQSHRKRIDARRLDMADNSIQALDPQQTVLLSLGNPRGVNEIPAQAGDPNSASASPMDHPVVVVGPTRLPDGIPGRWYGYDGVDAVVLDTNDDATMQALGTRGESLRQWVQHGGHLVVAVGGKWQAVNDGFLKEMLPARGAGRVKLADTGAIESFAGSNSKPLVPAGGPGMEVTKLELVEARSPRALDNTAATPVVVRGAYGFGRVTVIGLDVDQRPFLDWPSKRDFWLKALDLRMGADEAAAGLPPGAMRGRFFNNNASDISTSLHEMLQQFPGVKLVPFGWVAFFVFVYILLIGPGDYFFLKKVLKRMELTWVTFPLIVVGVSVLAYVAAYRIKGTDLRVNKLDLVDVDQTSGAPQLRGSTFFTVFSPQNRDYHVAIAPAPLGGRPIPSAKSAEVMVSWFGAPEAYFGGMGSTNRMSLSSTPYVYGPVGEPRFIDDARIPIWTTKGFAGRWFGRAPQVVESALERNGYDRVAGSVTNMLEAPLKGARLVFGKQVFDLGDLQPGETKTVNDRPETLSGYLTRLGQMVPNVNRNFGVAAPADPEATVSHRNEVGRLIMFYESASRSNQPGAGTLANGPLHALDLSGQLALDRPMLVAELDDEASTLDLGETSSTPKVDRTTVIRVILPLK